MDSLLSRYRNLTVLVLAILAQLLLLAYQVRSNQDVRLIRIWAVTAVTPLARTLEAVRSSVTGFFGNYFVLHDLRQENQRMLRELGRLKMENQFLKTELSTADRARTLSAFQSRTPSRTVAARVIGIGSGTGSKAVYVDRGSLAGVQKGMAVVTPDGIVGKVMSVFPTASQVLLITDPTFAAGVISEKHRVRGTLKGLGYSTCRVDYVQNEETLDVGEAFFTSGDDRVFPKGLPVGRVKVARHGGSFKDILIDPSGLQGGLEEVLIVLEGVHQELPDQPAANSPIYLAPAPPAESTDAQVEPARPAPSLGGTDADRLRERYRALGEAQNHKFGEGGPGARPPDFTGLRNPLAPQPAAPQPAAVPRPTAQVPGQTPVRPPAAPQPAAVPRPTAQVPGQTPVQPPAAAKPKTEPPAAGNPPGAQ